MLFWLSVSSVLLVVCGLMLAFASGASGLGHADAEPARWGRRGIARRTRVCG